MIRLTRLLTASSHQTLPSKIAVWNLTKRCNLSCRHCYIDAKDGSQNEIKKDEAFNIIRQLASLDFNVILFSGGEPLLYDGLFELNAYAKTLGIKTCLSSNGTLITDSLAIKIKDGGFEYVGISIDGKRETHDKFRGISGSFDKAMMGIRLLKNHGIKRGIRFTLNRENVNDLEDVISLCEKEEIERFCLYHLVYTGRGRENMDIGNRERIKVIEYLIKKVKSGIKIEVLTVDNHCDGIFLIQSKEKIREALNGGCRPGVKIINIAPDGNVYPCQFFKKSLGNIKNTPLLKILNNELIKLLNDRGNLKGKCGECIYKELCGGCRVRAYATNSSYFDEDPACYLENYNT